MSSEKKTKRKKIASIHVYRQEKKLPNVKTSCCIYVRYIAGVLKRRSNLAAKSKVQLQPLAAVALTASFKFLEGAASWLVACKSNKYEVIVHGQKNSIDLFIEGLLKEICTLWVRQSGFHGI